MTAHQVGPRDFVLGIAASGTTPYVRGALERAAELGAHTGIVACSPPADSVLQLVDVAIIPITGAEPVTGSTRMKAGTATKLVLNAISTGAMIRIGKTFGNLMVDLRAMSAKLVDRGERIVMEVTGIDRAKARALIDAAGGSVRTAIVMQQRGFTREEAERRAARCGRRRATRRPPCTAAGRVSDDRAQGFPRDDANSARSHEATRRGSWAGPCSSV